MISQLVPNKNKIQATFSIFFLLHKTVCPGLQKGWPEKVKVIMKFPQGKKRGGGGGGAGYLGEFLLGTCHWLLRTHISLQSFLWPIIDPILDNFGQMLFLWSQKISFWLCIYLFLHPYLQEFSFTSNPKNVWPHSSNSIENATPQIVIQSWKCNFIQQHIPIG